MSTSATAPRHAGLPSSFRHVRLDFAREKDHPAGETVANADAAAIVTAERVAIIPTSRADSAACRRASIAVAVCCVGPRREGSIDVSTMTGAHDD